MMRTDIVDYLFLEHPHSTKNPQTYWAHGAFSIVNSVMLIFFALLGIIHGIVPRLFPFSTSSAIIRSFGRLVVSDRHEEEISRILTQEVIADVSEIISKHP